MNGYLQYIVSRGLVTARLFLRITRNRHPYLTWDTFTNMD